MRAGGGAGGGLVEQGGPVNIVDVGVKVPVINGCPGLWQLYELVPGISWHCAVGFGGGFCSVPKGDVGP
jgi:hypothetical protein